ncbi:MAG: site-2 protease family protein [Bryobacteraceae bacterium]|nr:site-2 protease family protein [Bryobacteraceae bacterium]
MTATALGSRLQTNFDQNLPAFDLDRDWAVFYDIWRTPRLLIQGLPYSISLLGILLAHEFGHYFACTWHGVRASLPYFLPAPTFIGTFGAFIRFRSAIAGRRELFDIGIAGPLAGFVFVLPALGIGLALSRVVPGIGNMGEISFGTPLLMRWAEAYVFPGVDPVDISLHPVARAAWVGLLATALNLLPVGQLDGGHLIYAVAGEWHSKVALAAILLMVPLGFLYWPWWFWAVVLFFVGRKHFHVFGRSGLGKGRLALFALTAVIFAISFIAAPVQYNSPQSILGQ